MPTPPLQAIWDVERLIAPPAVHSAALDEPGVRGLFFDALPWRGRPTSVFAWIALPADATDANPAPGVVLVHGGGGTAFADWVRLWTARGYAAVAMDLNGHVPVGRYDAWESHDHAGPVGNAGLGLADDRGPWAQPLEPIEDNWAYHAAANVMLAHSLLAAQPRVDAGRIGITGISWGGWLTCILAGLDQRLRCAAPVYGCGLIHEASKWQADGRLDRAAHAAWIETFEPSPFLRRATLPMLWVNGTNDMAYWLPSWVKSSRLPPGERTLSLQLRMPHAHHGPGERPAEIHAFFDHHLKGGPPLPRWIGSTPHGEVARVKLLYTRDEHAHWPQRTWIASPDPTPPADATAWAWNAIDSKGRIVSSEPVIRD